MSLDDDLTRTKHTIGRLRARRPDNLEDYFHDAICRALTRKIPLTDQGYLYKSVYNRIACGREERDYVLLDEGLVEDTHSLDRHLKLDVQQALKTLRPVQYLYIYEFFYEGYTCREIARRHYVTFQAVNQAIQRALQAMKRILQHETETEI
jgi:DNA-directed RNA polymerase specialized sigma24 family protein